MIGTKTRANFGYYLAFHAARYAFPIIVTPFLAHYLLRDGFGHYAVINSCVWTSTVFMEFGFYLYGINRIAAADGVEDIGRAASAIVGGKIVLVPLCVAVYLALAGASGVLASNPAASLIGTISAVAYGASFAWYFQGRQRGATAVMLEGAPQLLQLGLILLLIRSPGELWLVLLIQAMAPVAAVTGGVLLMRRDGVQLRINLLTTREALVGAKPYFVERLCFTFYTAITPTIVAVLSSLPEAAVYAIGDKVGIFLGSLALPVSQTMMPVIARIAHQQRHAWKLPLLVVAGTVLFCAAVAAIVSATVGEAIALLFSSVYAAAVPVARIFCVAAVFSSLSMALANFVIIPRGAAPILIWSATIGLAVSLLLQFALVPLHGAVGAAFARGAAELTTAVILTGKAALLYRASRRDLAALAYEAGR